MPFQSNFLSIAVWAIFFGIVFSVVYITLQKHSLSKFVLGLIDAKAFNWESSKTLSELGISNKFIQSVIYYAIKSQHGLIRIIGFNCSDNQKLPGEFSNITPSDNCTFYIDENSCKEAYEKYSSKKSKKAYVIICIVVLFIVAFFATTVISWLSSYAGNVFGNNSQSVSENKNNEDTFEKNDNETNEYDAYLDESDDIISDVYDIVSPSATEDAAENNLTSDNTTSVDENSEENSDEHASRPTIPKGPMN